MPLSVRVRDGVGVLALLLMGAGASLSALRMLTGQTRSGPGEALVALLLALGLLGAGGYFAFRLWAAGGGDWVPLPPPPKRGLAPLELRIRRRLNSTEWLLLPVLLLTMGFSLVVAVAWSLAGLNVVSQLVWLAVGVWWLIGGLLLRGMYHRVRGPHRQGPVLRIEPRGIIDLRPPMQGFVPWEEIRHVEGVLLRSRPVLVVWFQPGAPSRQRVAARPLNWLAGQPGDWFIDLDELDGSLTAVERHARQCLAAAWRG